MANSSKQALVRATVGHTIDGSPVRVLCNKSDVIPVVGEKGRMDYKLKNKIIWE